MREREREGGVGGGGGSNGLVIGRSGVRVPVGAAG